eukprot:Opistho-1_new@27653
MPGMDQEARRQLAPGHGHGHHHRQVRRGLAQRGDGGADRHCLDTAGRRNHAPFPDAREGGAMMMKNTSRAAGRGHAGGFSLIELMVAMAIGLLCTLVIASVLSVTEGQRRGTTSGADAQIGGSLALYAVQREVAMAGYGFASEPNAVGCNLQARFNGAVVTALPAQLAPVFITQGGAGVSDPCTLR